MDVIFLWAKGHRNGVFCSRLVAWAFVKSESFRCLPEACMSPPCGLPVSGSALDLYELQSKLPVSSSGTERGPIEIPYVKGV